MISWDQIIKEMVYPKNIGMEEMVRFYQKATNAQIKKLESILKRKNKNMSDWDDFYELIEKVLKIKILNKYVNK